MTAAKAAQEALFSKSKESIELPHAKAEAFYYYLTRREENFLLRSLIRRARTPPKAALPADTELRSASWLWLVRHPHPIFSPPMRPGLVVMWRWNRGVSMALELCHSCA